MEKVDDNQVFSRFPLDMNFFRCLYVYVTQVNPRARKEKS